MNGSAGCQIDGAVASCDSARKADEAGATIPLPPGISTIMLHIHHDMPDSPAGVPQIIGTDFFISPDNGDILHRVPTRPHPEGNLPSDYFYIPILSASDSSQDTSDEMIHCDPKVAAQLDELRRDVIRTTTGGGSGVEHGFRVDRINGQLVVSDIIASPMIGDIAIPINPNTTVATFHTHSYRIGAYPSGTDKDSAQGKGQRNAATNEKIKDGHKFISYILSGNGLKLFNGNMPKDTKGRERIPDAAKCPKSAKPGGKK